MSHNDLFAEIALTEHPAKTDEIEIKPLDLDKRYFASTNLTANPVKELTHAENLAQFGSDLASLRDKYQPFLQNLVPEAAIKRDVVQLTNFQFRYQSEADQDFANVLSGSGSWEEVTIPDYRGPTGIDGKWTAFYRTEFAYTANAGKRVYLVFKGVDYMANVYLNNKCIGSHEGFFAPFEFDITDSLAESNVLVVEVKNDYTSLGNVEGHPILDGDKLYAATGPGWDDPEVGWHHCPPGAGIYNSVLIEERAELFVQDIFVRPDIDHDQIEIWVDIYNSSDYLAQDFTLEIAVYSSNLDGQEKLATSIDVPYAGPGANCYRYQIPFSDYKLWEPESPWLYTARISLSQEEQLLDIRDRNFGMRKFHSDEMTKPKGTLYLNNQPIILRGANEMGHLQQCVMNSDYQQLIDDILIAKLANMNYYRITQRPVQEEIYDYLDMLGMMHQCDFPLFGTLRRNQFYEAIKQVGEMERLIRSHPSSIMVSFINEPVAIRKHPDPKHKYNRRYREKAHRHLFRQELEYFFVVARKAIALENPDRVVKNVEGDYDPPTAEGLPDFHCYCMWYTNHAVPLGKLHKGYLAPFKPGWKVTCGEYGTEGLDSFPVMQMYPKHWLPASDEATWIPDKIVRAQTWTMHGDWFPEQENIHAWIEHSQKHQALATRLMTDAFRRRSDLMIGTALHILIDAWPSGWMKAIVGVDRIPKPAYFEFQASLVPVRVNLRSDRWQVYSGETVEVEAWVLNDTPESYQDCQVVVTLRDDHQDYYSYALPCDFSATNPSYIGTVKATIPKGIEDRSKIYLDAALIDATGRTINTERLTLVTFGQVTLIGDVLAAYLDDDEAAKGLLDHFGLKTCMLSKVSQRADVIVVSSGSLVNDHEQELLTQVKAGAHLIVMQFEQEPFKFSIADHQIETKRSTPIYFAAVDSDIQIMKQFSVMDFAYLYNAQLDMIDFIADSYLLGDNLRPLIYTYQKRRPDSNNDKKVRLPLVGRFSIGSGQVTVCNLRLAGKLGYNPVLDRLILSLIIERVQ